MNQITLFTPGPTHIPERVLQAMHRSGDHHRTPEFRSLFQETRELLQSTFHAPEAPLLITCSGSGGMEAVLSTGVSTNDVLGYLDAGKFGSRWGAIAEAHNIPTHVLKIEWGQSPTVEEVRAFLTQHSDITHFALQYCETSTTVLHNVPAIAEMMKKEFPDTFLFVDAISAATTLDIDLRELPIDALILAAQKAFMLPPGLSMLSLSERYWNHAESLPPRSLYFNLTKERATQMKGNAAWTPAMSIIYGLREALQVFIDEGWDNVYARHAACSEVAKQEFLELGFTLVNAEHMAPGVSGGHPGKGVEPDVVRNDILMQFGLRTAGGQDHWKGKVIRIGHMGVITPEDVTRCFDAMKDVVKKQ